ncbi:hypothetical protein [Rhodococcus rhodochrous]|uniref:hypothetical protein n=1 Tax=Rhodococcus rhodochrous TaxID=1829 RepID=UPI0024BB628D|nr:hypothetical protein [Rhodococcus rhodochrous]MDJ0400573.1 hypothetical protein [Rhodococcus rhodochrous]
MSPISGASSHTVPAPSPAPRLVPACSRENHSTVGWITPPVAAATSAHRTGTCSPDSGMTRIAGCRIRV